MRDPMPLKAAIRAAQAPSPWRVGNDVLYDLCSTRPKHTNRAEVIAKIWLIGRSYAAAIERRKAKSEENDEFYVNTVAPAITESNIDGWIREARRYGRPCAESWPTLLQVHHETTQLFSRISGLEKRALASKYLHFHVPQLFYIYDTRALEALRMLRKIVGRARRSTLQADNEYRKFSEKCLSLQRHVKEEYGTSLSPRVIDNLLLYLHETKPDLSLKRRPLNRGLRPRAGSPGRRLPNVL
jgi:hypothetical protein